MQKHTFINKVNLYDSIEKIPHLDRAPRRSSAHGDHIIVIAAAGRGGADESAATSRRRRVGGDESAAVERSRVESARDRQRTQMLWRIAIATEG
jgi:hypothetical protein